MQRRTSRHHAAAAEIELLTSISADVSAREFHQRDTGGKVPGSQSSFPVTILTTGSHKGQIHSVRERVRVGRFEVEIDEASKSGKGFTHGAAGPLLVPGGAMRGPRCVGSGEPQRAAAPRLLH